MSTPADEQRAVDCVIGFAPRDSRMDQAMTRARATLDLATKSLTITGPSGGIWSGVSIRSADRVAARAGWAPSPGTPHAVLARSHSSPPDGFTWGVTR